MKSEHKYLFLDKPETLECIVFSLHKYYKNDCGHTIPADSSFRLIYGCCLCPTFDKEIEYKTFLDWDRGQARLNEALQYWTDKGFKSRKELGIIADHPGLTHDESVAAIRKQLFELFLNHGK